VFGADFGDGQGSLPYDDRVERVRRDDGALDRIVRTAMEIIDVGHNR
jgi:hypothetical protein